MPKWIPLALAGLLAVVFLFALAQNDQGPVKGPDRPVEGPPPSAPAADPVPDLPARDEPPAEPTSVDTGESSDPETGGSVAGIVLGEHGAPLAEPFRVTLRRGRVGSGGPSREFSDGLGAFEFSGLPPGQYTATASAPLYASGSSSAFTVRKGETTRGVTISLARGGRVTGLVVRARTGAPVAGATVVLNTQGMIGFMGQRGIQVGGGRKAKTDRDGRFAFEGVKPGKYGLVTMAEDLPPGRIDEVLVERGRETGGLLLSLGEGGAITGTVYGPNGKPLPGAEVLVSRVIPNVYMAGDFGARIKADENGVYLVEHLEPGRYRVRRPTGSGAGFGVSFAISGMSGREEEKDDEPMDEDTVRVREGEVTRRDLSDELHSAIRGVVVDGEGKPLRKQVTLEDRNKKPDRGGIAFKIPRFTHPNAKGEFSFWGLAPGEYTLAVSGVRHEVTLARGETREVRLRVPTGRIEGVVLDASGKPVSGATITPIRLSGGTMFFRSISGPRKTDERGRFTVPDLGPGKYRLDVEAKGAVGRSDDLDLAPDQVLGGVRILVESTVEVRLQVRNAAGEPVEDGWVTLLMESESRGSAQVGAGGVAILHVVPGTYIAHYTAEGLRPGERATVARKEIVVEVGGTQSIPLRIE